MDFYVIVLANDGSFTLVEEDGRHEAASLTDNELQTIIQRLSTLFWQQTSLPLDIRTYVTVYYNNSKTEYISLKSTPSVLLTSYRRTKKQGNNVALDGFAITFLEGEEENRVWIGEDGVVENRGMSQKKVRQMLNLLVESLNMGQTEQQCLIQQSISLSWQSVIQLLSTVTVRESLEDVLDLNQEEVTWCRCSHDGLNWEQLEIADLMINQIWEQVEVDLLAPKAHYRLRLDQENGLATLWQVVYPWEEAAIPEALWDNICSAVVHDKG